MLIGFWTSAQYPTVSLSSNKWICTLIKTYNIAPFFTRKSVLGTDDRMRMS